MIYTAVPEWPKKTPLQVFWLDQTTGVELIGSIRRKKKAWVTFINRRPHFFNDSQFSGLNHDPRILSYAAAAKMRLNFFPFDPIADSLCNGKSRPRKMIYDLPSHVHFVICSQRGGRYPWFRTSVNGEVAQVRAENFNPSSEFNQEALNKIVQIRDELALAACKDRCTLNKEARFI